MSAGPYEIACIGMCELTPGGDHVNAESVGRDPEWWEIIVTRQLEGGEIEEVETSEPLRFVECHRKHEILCRKYGIEIEEDA